LHLVQIQRKKAITTRSAIVAPTMLKLSTTAIPAETVGVLVGVAVSMGVLVPDKELLANKLDVETNEAEAGGVETEEVEMDELDKEEVDSGTSTTSELETDDAD